mgnify:CR=1 FL=1
MVFLPKVWPVLWRLAILVLPWQTRWFWEGPMVGGFPWEQGRVSVYASWLLLFLAMTCAWAMPRPLSSVDTPAKKYPRLPFIFLILFTLLPSVLFSLSIRATAQWLFQVTLLGAFFVSLSRQRIPSSSIIRWMILAMVPHIILAFFQIGFQMVWGHPWLGMAMQDPAVLGVSVIDIAGHRMLRAYGGFPHPNILAGWLAFLLPWCWLLALRASTRRAFVGWMGIQIAFIFALIFTFSRAGWLAALLALTMSMVVWFVRTHAHGRRILCLVVSALLCLVVAHMGMRQVFMERVQVTSRLEQRSLQERVVALKQGWELFKRHPSFGVGPGATIYALEHDHVWQPSSSLRGPPAPPHLVPLLVLDEIGVLGMMGLLFIMGLSLRRVNISVPVTISISTFIFLGAFDHYLWSLWSGQTLAIYMGYALFSSDIDVLVKSV